MLFSDKILINVRTFLYSFSENENPAREDRFAPLTGIYRIPYFSCVSQLDD